MEDNARMQAKKLVYRRPLTVMGISFLAVIVVAVSGFLYFETVDRASAAASAPKPWTSEISHPEFQLAAFRWYADVMEFKAIQILAGNPTKYRDITAVFAAASKRLDDLIEPHKNPDCPDNYMRCPNGTCVPPGGQCLVPLP